MPRVALALIYNHQFNGNIPVLEALYSKRFSHIFHLVPFYEGTLRNVIPVHGNSHYFQGYVAQAYNVLKYYDFDHIIYAADDLLINPIINEDNYDQHFCTSKEVSFVSGFISLHERTVFWHRVGEAFRWNKAERGVEVTHLLPDYNEALDRLRQFGLTIKPLRFDQIWQTPTSLQEFVTTALRHPRYTSRLLSLGFVRRRLYDLPYPLVGGYSDIFVVSNDAAQAFATYCGIFAATQLFVELAIPTAMVFAATHIVTELDLSLRGKALWEAKDYDELEPYKFDLSHLLADFPKNYLYIHPIKLSKWKWST